MQMEKNGRWILVMIMMIKVIMTIISNGRKESVDQCACKIAYRPTSKWRWHLREGNILPTVFCRSLLRICLSISHFSLTLYHPSPFLLRKMCALRVCVLHNECRRILSFDAFSETDRTGSELASIFMVKSGAERIPFLTFEAN